ncbi:MAG: hypothetical protein GEU80_09180 [Dehalococcoidia bacterium]|nr:hypothetical protein [Dehalococcoidia bacterium]
MSPVVAYWDTMSPEELKQWIGRSPYTVTQLAVELHVSRSTVYRWLSGEVGIPGTVPLALRGLRTTK